jgi:hypothetical protein
MKYGKLDISLSKIGNKAVAIIKYGKLMIWQAIKSCFGSGYWVNEKSWINDEPFKN